VEDEADLDEVLDAVQEAAAAAGVAIQVDVWPGGWTGNEPLPEPFVQAFLGHEHRGALIWIEDGAVEVAVDPSLELWPQPIAYERGARLEEMDGEWTRLRPDGVRRVLADYVASGRRPSLCAWVDPFDDEEQDARTA
jgi:hypothetical protein